MTQPIPKPKDISVHLRRRCPQRVTASASFSTPPARDRAGSKDLDAEYEFLWNGCGALCAKQFCQFSGQISKVVLRRQSLIESVVVNRQRLPFLSP
jgi:hypothetical protein